MSEAKKSGHFQKEPLITRMNGDASVVVHDTAQDQAQPLELCSGGADMSAVLMGDFSPAKSRENLENETPDCDESTNGQGDNESRVHGVVGLS